MNPHPKQRRETDRPYLDWIKTLPCCVGFDCLGPPDPAHLETVGAFGSDYSAAPMCRKHHDELHDKGIEWMQQTYRLLKLNLWREAWRCLKMWAKV